MTAGSAVRWRPLVLLAAGLVVSAVALWIVLRGVDLARTAEIVAGAHPGFLVAAVGVLAGQAVVRAARWRLLLPLRPDGGAIPVRRVLPAMLVGYLGNTVMPARLGEVVRSALIARRESVAPGEALGSAVLERILDVLVLAVLGTLAAVAIAAPGWMTGVALAGVGVAALGLGVAGVVGFAAHRGKLPGIAVPDGARRLAPLTGFVARVAAGARVLDRPAAIGGAAGLTLVAWLLDATIFWLVARALGLDLPPVEAMLVSAVAVLSTAVPTAPGYIGTFELAAVAAAGVAGIAGEAAVAFAVLAHVVAIVPLSLAGAGSLWVVGGRSLRDLAASAPLPRAVP